MQRPLEVDFDTVSAHELITHLSSPIARLRGDAACAIGDRLRTNELSQLPATAHNRLVELLSDPVPLVCFEAAMALAELQDRRGTDVLLQAMAMRRFRLDAVRALGTMGDPRAIEPLSRLMQGWLTPWADKLQAAAALCALNDTQGADYLKLRLSSKRFHERAAAIHFLGESKHPDAKQALLALLADPAEPMRDVAARALGLLGDKSTRPALEAARHNADAELQQDIHMALERLS